MQIPLVLIEQLNGNNAKEVVTKLILRNNYNEVIIKDLKEQVYDLVKTTKQQEASMILLKAELNLIKLKILTNEK